MKFAVHWAPSVNVWTPGWSGAVAAGAQADALPARASSAATARSAAASIVRVFKFVSPVENGLEVRLAPSWGQRLFLPRRRAKRNQVNTWAVRVVTTPMQLAVTGYLVVQSVHIMAVVAAYGLPMAYPLLLPYLRRRHPRSMPGVHDVQYRLKNRLTGPDTGSILKPGVYRAFKHHLWGETWVAVPVAIIAVIAVVGGAVIVPSCRRMATLARADVDSAGGAGAIAWSNEYNRVWVRYLVTEV